MRLAMQAPSPKAVEAADQGFAKNSAAKKLLPNGAVRASMSCELGAARTAWFDDYVTAKGKFAETCGERHALFKPDAVIAQVADQVFFHRHPELKSKPISTACHDGALRTEWMDLYIEFGGLVTEVCTTRKC